MRARTRPGGHVLVVVVMAGQYATPPAMLTKAEMSGHPIVAVTRSVLLFVGQSGRIGEVMMRGIDERVAGGWSLVLAGVAFACFWLPSAFELFRDGGPWVLGLGLHALTFVCLSVGLFLVGRRIEGPRWLRAAWRTGAVFVIVGSVGGWLPMAAGLVLLGVLEILRRHPLAGWALALGGVLVMAVYLSGSHLGDENSPSPDDLERILAVAGVALVATGFGLLGAVELSHRGDLSPQSEATSVSGGRTLPHERAGDTS
jgi:hypothetical protein